MSDYQKRRRNARAFCSNYLVGVFLEVHVGVLVGIDEFEAELVDIKNGANVQVAQRVVPVTIWNW